MKEITVLEAKMLYILGIQKIEVLWLEVPYFAVVILVLTYMASGRV